MGRPARPAQAHASWAGPCVLRRPAPLTERCGPSGTAFPRQGPVRPPSASSSQVVPVARGGRLRGPRPGPSPSWGSPRGWRASRDEAPAGPSAGPPSPPRPPSPRRQVPTAESPPLSADRRVPAAKCRPPGLCRQVPRAACRPPVAGSDRDVPPPRADRETRSPHADHRVPMSARPSGRGSRRTPVAPHAVAVPTSSPRRPMPLGAWSRRRFEPVSAQPWWSCSASGVETSRSRSRARWSRRWAARSGASARPVEAYATAPGGSPEVGRRAHPGGTP